MILDVHARHYTGLLPYNFLCVQAGLVLSELEMLSVLDTWSFISLLGATLVLMTTTLLVRRYRQTA